MHTKKLFCLILVLQLLVLPAAQAAQSLTFEDFLKKVQTHYPDLQRQNARAEEALAAKHEAIAGYFPSFKGVSEWTTGDDPVYVFSSLLKQRAFAAEDLELSRLNDPDRRSNLSFGVQGQWKLFDAFDTISRVKMTGHLAESEKLKAKSAERQVRLVAIEAYQRALMQEALAKEAEAMVADSTKDLAEAQSLNEKGMVLGADYYAAKVNGGVLEKMRNRFAKDSTSARILLNILMGEEPTQEIALTPTPAPAAVSDRPLKSWLEEAYAHREDFLAAEEEVQAMKAESLRQRMSFLPRISAVAEWDNDSHEWAHAESKYLIGFKGQMDLFEPGYGARAEEAAQKVRQAAQQKQALKDGLTRSLAEEKGLYDTVLSDLPVTEKMLEDAKNALTMTEKLYREGRKSVADLLEMRRAYLEVAVSLYETRFYSHTSLSRLEYLAGTL